MLELLVQFQGAIRSTLSGLIRAFADTRSWSGLLVVLPMGIVFGAAHALTPGHSKTVLAAYSVGSDLRPWKAILPAMALTFAHVGSAVLLATVANTLITRTIVGAGRAPALELTSQLLLCGVGAWLLLRAIVGRSHVHGEGLFVGLAAGLIPCPLTLFLMFYALSLGVPEAGLVFASAMFIGVGLVLVSVAVASAFLRDRLVNFVSRRGVEISHLVRAVDGIAGATLLVLALSGLAL